MTNHRQYFDWPVYGLSAVEKNRFLSEELTRLTWLHVERCDPYKKILAARGIILGTTLALEQIPFIPVRLFKEFHLSSVPERDIFKILTSSGTTGQQVSRIVLDRETSVAQTKSLVLILQNFLGKARLPMLIIDHPGVIMDRSSFSARGAGILGFSNFGRGHTYAQTDEMTPDDEAVQSFIERYGREKVLLFGFTFMVWRFFNRLLENTPARAPFKDATLIHGGGWKKLIEEAVDNDKFKKVLREGFNIQAIHNFYGMVEQVGSVFMECEEGVLHTPVFAEVLIRDARNWKVVPKGTRGLIQVLSVLPTSYPGHSLLTEDIGEWIGEDDCACGRLGKTFKVHGRIAQAELRGCSDTHASNIKNPILTLV